jgi:cellulose synthase/poly-beta-1,6-N-acetylglucosamine synthase-like glycosyltransferase
LITVVVACRNEALYLPKLLSSLAQQSFQNFELILVNDHSTDATLEVMKSAERAFKDVKVIDAKEFGKKSALKAAIECAKGNLIITTDGDCIPSFHWLESISSYYKKQPADLIICPVRLTNTESVFSGLQMLEFTSLVASGAAAAGAGMPILCNGANLAFTKKAWLKSQFDLRFDEQSGDDVFLLQSIKKRGGKIRFLKSESAFVSTEAASSISEFIKQRQRWAAKAPAYTDWQIILTACIIFSISLLELLIFAFSMYDASFWKVLIAVLTIKFIADTTFLYSVRNFFQLQKVWFYALILSFIYPFYIVFVTIIGLFFNPKSWK